jgi:hypothetical protein
MTEGMANTSSVFAAEGTAAHELAAHCLLNGFDANRFDGYVIDITANDAGRFLKPGAPLGDGNTRFEVDEEMADSVQTYLDYVRAEIDKAGKGAEWEVETRLDMRHVHPDIFGTGDTVLFVPKAKWLHIFDYKHGRGVVVEVEANPQLLTYATGVAHRFHNRQIEGITCHIVQPRAPHADGPIRSWDADLVTLMEFEDTLAKAAKATEDPNAPRIPGHWCNFCPGLPVCPEAREKATAAACATFAGEDAWVEDGIEKVAAGEVIALPPVEMLKPGRLAQLLREAEFIISWAKSVQAFAHEQACSGNPIPGYKLVQKRAMRRWRDEDEARAELAVIFDEDDILTEPKLKSPAQLEKVCGKKRFEQIAEALVHKVSSGTNLVPVSDPRPAAKNAGMEDFA